MRKTVPMQPADVAAWTEIARIAAEKLQDMFQRDKWAPPTTPATMRTVKPNPNNWMEWTATAPGKTCLSELILYRYLCEEVPDECRVVSLMQNEGE